MKNLKCNVLLLLLLSLMCNTVSGQSTLVKSTASKQNNAIMVEALGHGFLYSINYERRLFGNTQFQTSAQIGAAYYGEASGIVPLWVPISINQTVKLRDNKFVEFGVGKMFRNDGVVQIDGTFKDDYQLEEWIFRLGYKQYFKDDKYLLKIAYTPIYQDKSDFVHWGGIAFGYRF